MLQTIARMLGWMPRLAQPLEEIAAAPPPGLAVARGGDLGMPAPLDLDALRARNRARALAAAGRDQSRASR
jgi:hypothetical protein